MEIIIKLDHEEPVKVKTSSIYGELHPEDEPHPINEVIQDLNEQIQDLKLENDRLKQREDLYRTYLNKFDCHGVITCIRCTQYCPESDVPCKLALPINRHKIFNELKKKLEDL